MAFAVREVTCPLADSAFLPVSHEELELELELALELELGRRRCVLRVGLPSALDSRPEVGPLAKRD